MDDTAVLNAFCASGAFVPVTDPHAYEAFRDGKPLAHISPRAELLEQFYQSNKTEFYGKSMFARHEDGRFPYSELFGKRIWITYHLLAAKEKQSKELQGIIAEHPWLDG